MKNFLCAVALFATTYCPTASAMEAMQEQSVIPSGSAACFKTNELIPTIKEAGYRQVFGGTFDNDAGPRRLVIFFGPGNKWLGLILLDAMACPLFTGDAIKAPA